MEQKNSMKLKFISLSENETFARTVISAFCLPLNPSISELNDIKTAVSEAVTNAVVHAYPDTPGYVCMYAERIGKTVHIKISDEGIGIENLSEAIEPFFTSRPEEERSGMGFTIMQTFMDDVKITSELNKGTEITMSKTIASN